MNEGYVKIYRKMLDDEMICIDTEYWAIWCYLLLNATHTEYKSIFNGNEIILKPGQLITGRDVIASKFNINPSKVQRVLKKFEKFGKIEQQTRQ